MDGANFCAVTQVACRLAGSLMFLQRVFTTAVMLFLIAATTSSSGSGSFANSQTPSVQAGNNSAAAKDISGTWVAKAEGPMGEMEIV